MRVFAYATVLLVSVVAPAAGQVPRQDEEAIKRFDYHFDTVKQNLERADDERLVGLAADLETRLGNARKAPAPPAAPAPPPAA